MTITKTRIETARLATNVRLAGDSARPTLVLVHGNVSCGAFFEPLMEALSADFSLVAPDYRGFGESERKTIDATRGMGDLADDLAALIDTLNLDRPHLLGWSTGAGVVMRYALDRDGEVGRIVLESPVSPYGFGGTRGPEGRPNWDDYAGSGGGTANPDFVRMLAEKERGVDNPTSPRNVLRGFYVGAGFDFGPEFEKHCLDSMLRTSVGDDVYPGDLTTSENWPGVAPGTTGINNALSPKYMDVAAFAALDPAPPVLWIRGEEDQIVSDTSLFDFGYLGSLGLVPGWPGEEVFPPQPMVSQMRQVLARGGNYRELVYEECGHSPHLEQPDRFVRDLREFLLG